MENFDAKGRFIPDPNPVEVPLRFRRPEPLNELIKRLVRNELSQEAADLGEETFEEADDFDMDDEDPEPFSSYELSDMDVEDVSDYTLDKQEGPSEAADSVQDPPPATPVAGK